MSKNTIEYIVSFPDGNFGAFCTSDKAHILHKQELMKCYLEKIRNEIMIFKMLNAIYDEIIRPNMDECGIINYVLGFETEK